MDSDELRFRRRAAIAVGLVLAVGLLVAAAVLAAKVLLVLFAGVLVAVFLRALAYPIRKLTRLPAKWAVGVVTLLLVAITALAGLLVGPSIAEQAREMREAAPQAIDDVRAKLGESPWGTRLLEEAEQQIGGGANGEQGEGAEQGGGGPSGNGGAIVEAVVAFLAMSLQTLVYLLIIVVSGIYLAIAPEPYVDGVVRLCPPAKRPRAREVLDTMGRTLRWFLVGRAISMVAVGVLTGFGLMLLDVPFAGVLGVIAGLLTFVPYAGPITASVPIALVALSEGPDKLLYAMAFYTGVQCLEGFVITPIAQERVIKLLPVLTLAAEALMGWLFGPLGIIVSVPLAAALMVFVKKVYIEGVLQRTARSEDGAGAAPHEAGRGAPRIRGPAAAT